MGRNKTYTDAEVVKVRTCAWSPPGDHPVGCGMYLHVKDGKVVKVEGDPDHPITNGRLCPRCLALPEMMYNSERILHPMKRAKEDRGKDNWKQISWDEAYDLIESNAREIMSKFGPESIFTMTGTGRESTLYACTYAPLLFGSPNQGTPLSGNACYGPRCTIANYHLGAGYPELDYAAFFPDRYDDPRYEVPKYIILWGKDPIYSNPDGFFGHAVIDLMKRGSKLITVDPRVTWLSTRAEYHLQLRPGTDTVVGMGMINVIITEDLYDHEFVEKWCYGFKALAERVSEFTLDYVEEVSWVPREILQGAARAFANNRPSSAMWGLAIDTCKNGVQAGHAFLALCSICGYMDVPGGITLAKPSSFMGKWRYGTLQLVKPEIQARRIVDLDGRYECYNYGDAAMPAYLADSLLDWLEMDEPPYPLKMSWMIGVNLLSCMSAQPKRWLDGMLKVDFTIAQDVFMTPSAMALADLFLPLSTFAEHDGVVIPHFGRNTHFIGAINKAVEPIDTKSDLEILIDMGRRMNPDLFPWKNVSEFFTEQLNTVYDWGFEDLKKEVVHQQDFEYRKYELGKLRADGEPGFETPTGLIELKSTLYPTFGEDALPYFEEPDFSPYSCPADVVEKYPLVLTSGGRNVTMFHSEHRQSPTLRSINPWPRVTIHPDTAAQYGIDDGDWVSIENPLGSCVQKAHVRKTIDPRVVHAEHGWWFPEQEGESPNLFGAFKANVNNLVPHESVSKLGYGAPYKNVICSVRKVESLDGKEVSQ